ncbi:PRC-barrel domain-containing protein [Natronorubrum halophilum]|uniref:PRC-barrel domain-containing protein n=1 Tax=Natronorubrum halophilum TaxID=1702106 RepID=UPI000EF6E031|nr:PRC-barrel domain-containing protein [Natronorubrum halophilum]
MSEVFAKTLTEKSVVGVDGVEFGLVHNITLNPVSGELVDLVVEPSQREEARSVNFETNEDDRLLVPIDCIQVVKDAIVVQYRPNYSSN